MQNRVIDLENGVRLRDHRVGDIGWCTYRHGTLYHEEYGWDERFEALVGEVLAKFVQNYDPQMERCWIAQGDESWFTSRGHSESEALELSQAVEDSFLGCVFLVRIDERTCKLRCLLVEPCARGLGLGRKLVDECIAFAKQCGYERMILWTNDILLSARKIYLAKGFSLIEESPHELFGEGLTGQTWELKLK